MTAPAGSIKWTLKDVLVAGKRHSGSAWGRSPKEAIGHFAAKTARELKVDVSTAVASAQGDPYKKVEPDTSGGGYPVR